MAGCLKIESVTLVATRARKREPHSLLLPQLRVRSAEIERLVEDRDRPGPSASDRAIDSCRRAVEDRIRRDGYDRVNIRSINVDDRPGRNDWVVGTADADARDRRGGSFNFSCSVDLRDGDVRSVDVNRR